MPQLAYFFKKLCPPQLCPAAYYGMFCQKANAQKDNTDMKYKSLHHY